MTMQWAFSNSSSGIPLSGAVITSGEALMPPPAAYRIVVLGQQRHNRQSGRQYHSHLLTFSVDHWTPRGTGRHLS